MLYKRSLYTLVHVSGNAFRADADSPTCEISQGCFVNLSIDCLLAFSLSLVLFFYILYVVTHVHTQGSIDCFSNVRLLVATLCSAFTFSML